jgi:hypothetical protein
MSFRSFTEYIKSTDPKKIQASKLSFRSRSRSQEPFVKILHNEYNRNTNWTENQAYRFYDDLYKLYLQTNGQIFDSPDLVKYFRYLFSETQDDQKADIRKFSIRDQKFIPILNFPNHIHYHCMRCLFLIDPDKLDSKLVRFIYLLYVWLEENAITGSRLHIYYDDRHSSIKNDDIPTVIKYFSEKLKVPNHMVEFDRLSNTHVVMLWKNTSL